jgi:hypothetical protein
MTEEAQKLQTTQYPNLPQNLNSTTKSYDHSQSVKQSITRGLLSTDSSETRSIVAFELYNLLAVYTEQHRTCVRLIKPPDIPQESKRNRVQKEKKKTAKSRVSGKVVTDDEWATRKKDAAVAQARGRILPPRKTNDTDTTKKTNKTKMRQFW